MQKINFNEVIAMRPDVLEHVAVDEYVNDRIQKAVNDALTSSSTDKDGLSEADELGIIENIVPTNERAYAIDEGNLLICLDIKDKEFCVLVSPECWEWREDSVANANGGELNACEIKLVREPALSNRAH